LQQLAHFGLRLSTSTMAKHSIFNRHTWRSYWWLPLLLGCILWLLLLLAESYRRSRRLQQQLEQPPPHTTHAAAGANHRAGCLGQAPPHGLSIQHL
jgi:hypothetical protein